MVLVQILEGFHGFLEERKGNQSSPTEYKGRGEGGGGYIKLTGLIRWSQKLTGLQWYYRATRGDHVTQPDSYNPQPPPPK